MAITITPVVCGHVIISLTVDSDEKAASAEKIRNACGRAGITLRQAGKMCDDAGISYTHMYIRGRSGFIKDAVECIKYLLWARTTGSGPHICRK